jgi:hypothetical protein
MRRGVVLLFMPAPAFALSDAMSALLPTLLEGGATVAGMMLLFHASIAGVKMLHLNFMSDQEISDGPAIQDFSTFTPVTTESEWSEMSTHLDYHSDPSALPDDRIEPDYHDPGLRFDHIELDDSFDAGSGPDWSR